MTRAEVAKLRAAMLEHYDRQGRTLPWRVRPEDRARGVVADPYAVWLSEIMLQQTTVAHATPYWQRFLTRFPTVSDLANAERDLVLTLWAGLGYYARARNLHKCAAIIRDLHGGVFPDSEAELLKLPGIGPYTAATIAAICFDEPTTIVDGNVERVISRLFAVDTPLPKSRSEIRALAAILSDPHGAPERPGDYGQAVMDLGARTCTPRAPKCDLCPWQSACAAFAKSQQLDYPKKIKKAKLPIRYGEIFILTTPRRLLLQRRPDTGLLGGMMGFPGSPWRETGQEPPLTHAPMPRNWERCAGTVRHIFTHFDLRLTVYRAEISASEKPDIENGEWVLRRDIKNYALPSVMTKVYRASQTAKPSAG